MIPREVIEKARYAVCSVGVATKTDAEISQNPKSRFFEIVGTGFLVRSDVVMTNGHVVQGLNDLYQQVRQHIPTARRAIQFTFPREPTRLPADHAMVLVAPLRHYVLGNPDFDVGLIQFDPRVPDDAFTRLCHPLPVIDTVADIRVGDEVGVMGFPYGTDLHVDQRLTPEQISRLGPILQQGYVSGVQPVEGHNQLNDLLLDVRIIGGFSGSPVFRKQTGELIGVVYATMNALYEEEVPEGEGSAEAGVAAATAQVRQKWLPASVIGKAAPMDRRRIEALLKIFDQQNEGLVGGTANYDPPPS